MDESEVRRLMAQLLSEAGLTGEVQADWLARQGVSLPLGADRAARLDMLAREQEERHRLTEEQVRRPHYYIHQAKTEVDEFRQQLLPLLAQADQALTKLVDRAGDRGMGSASLAATLSAASAQAIARNADQLGDMVLDSLLDDTVGWLNVVEQQKEADRHAARATSSLAEAWERVEEYEAQAEEMRRKYLDAPQQQQNTASSSGASASAPAPRVSEPVEFGQPSLRTASPPRTYAHASRSAQQQQQPQQPQPQPQLRSLSPSPRITAAAAAVAPGTSAGVARSAYPPASTFAPSAVPALPASYAAASASAAGVPLPPLAHSARLPSLPGLVLSVQAQRAAMESFVADKHAGQQFLLPGQLGLHSIVAAAGDDVLDALIDSVVAEVAGVCDGFVERVFDAEFQVNLEQDWEELERQQQQQQQQEHEQQEQQGQQRSAHSAASAPQQLHSQQRSEQAQEQEVEPDFSDDQ
jgi:hypothetical protein